MMQWNYDTMSYMHIREPEPEYVYPQEPMDIDTSLHVTASPVSFAAPDPFISTGTVQQQQLYPTSVLIIVVALVLIYLIHRITSSK